MINNHFKRTHTFIKNKNIPMMQAFWNIHHQGNWEGSRWKQVFFFYVYWSRCQTNQVLCLDFGLGLTIFDKPTFNTKLANGMDTELQSQL